MKALLLILLAVFAFSFYLNSQTTTKLQAPVENRNLATRFASWKRLMGKIYASKELEAYRMSVFGENLAYIEAENARQSDYVLGETQFADLTTDEFVANHLGYVHQSEVAASEDYAVPNAAFSWVTEGAVGPVKNQGSCGSCWAFSATGTIEGYWAISHGEIPNLSEQQLVDCVSILYGCLGCNGG
jgi:C1A family cysteine protease